MASEPTSTESRGLDPPMIAWTLLYQTYTAVFKTMERALLPLGISPPQAFALAAIYYTTEPMTPGRLAGLLAQETQSLTGLVDRMETQGWVTRRRDLPDRRTIRLALTPAGEAKLDEVMPFNAKAAAEVFAGLTPNRLAELSRTLDEMRPVVLEQIGLNPERFRDWPPV
ncbi:MAG: MarR family winged helix-turn-helix transcriptional regulator [Dehalococcoidia bacterium]